MTIENPALLFVKNRVRRWCPMLLPLAGRVYASTIGFSRERAYLKRRPESGCEMPSLLLMSCNRAATQFTESVLARIYEHGGGTYIALNRYLFFADREAPRHVLDPEHMRGLMQPKGYFYGQQGPYSSHDGFGEFKRVTMVRDPRDLVVSNFYSLAYAHVPRDRAFVERIREAQEMGLQRFVLKEELLTGIEACLSQNRALRGRDGVLSCRYEDMMDDFTGFQESCQRFILGDVDPALSAEVEQMFKGPEDGDSESVTRHRRSGRWGQFREALDPDVIDRLNERFGPHLAAFGYEP